jgi:hypothetical protein
MSQSPTNPLPNTLPTPPASPSAPSTQPSTSSGTQSSSSSNGTKSSNEVMAWLFFFCLIIGASFAIYGAFIQNNIIMSVSGIVTGCVGIVPIGLQQAFPGFFTRLKKTWRTGLIIFLLFLFVASLLMNIYNAAIGIRSGKSSLPPSFPITHPTLPSKKANATSTPAPRPTPHPNATPTSSSTPAPRPNATPSSTPTQIPTPVVVSNPTAVPTITNFNGWEQKEGKVESCIVYNGTYQDFESQPTDANLCRMLNTPSAANFDASITLSISSAASGVCGGFVYDDDPDNTSYYRVQVCPSAHTVVWIKRFDGSPNNLGTATNIVSGNTFSLRVTMANGVLSVFVNGKRITFLDTNHQSVQEDLSKPLPHSLIGVVASTHSGDVTVTFSQPVIHFS